MAQHVPLLSFADAKWVPWAIWALGPLAMIGTLAAYVRFFRERVIVYYPAPGARSRTIRMISFSHRVGAVWTSAMPPRPSIYGGYWRHYRSRSWRRGNRSLSCTRAPMTHFTNSASNNQTCWTRSQRNN